MENPKDWIKAVEQTWVVRFPKQHLATFGITNIDYYIVTEPIYQEIDTSKKETVIRTGKVHAERPTIVTPTYAMNLEGFSSEAFEYFQDLAREFGPNSPGVMYQYKNEPKGMEIVSGISNEVAHKISEDLDQRNENMGLVMVGVDEYWDVALLKFIYEYTSSSLSRNVSEFQSKGLLDPQSAFDGVPKAAIIQIERLFSDAERGNSTDRLKQELDRWGVFRHYEDRFLALFRSKRGF
jgi:hypothetical protein